MIKPWPHDLYKPSTTYFAYIFSPFNDLKEMNYATNAEGFKDVLKRYERKASRQMLEEKRHKIKKVLSIGILVCGQCRIKVTNEEALILEKVKVQ